MRALIAFDKFKDALTAREACDIAAQSLTEARPDWEIETAPLADGGDGFCDTLTGAVAGDFYHCDATGPLGKPTRARFGIVSKARLPSAAQKLLAFSPETNRIAVIEMAESSGIALTPLQNRSPWITSSAGLGDQLLGAVERGASGAILGLGGSATHDLALGALWRLGFDFLDAFGRPLTSSPTPELWPRIAKIVPNAKALPEAFEIRIACDVDNPLLGENGAAAIFGPQKGLTPERLGEMEGLTRRMAELLCQSCHEPSTAMEQAGAGAAGGAAFGLRAGLKGRLTPGYQLVKDWIGLEAKLERTDLVITGEGRFDASSLRGKGPGELALETRKRGKRLHIFAGSLGDAEELPFPPDSLHAITPPATPLETALETCAENLRRSLAQHFA